ncbi:hypothetical protein OROHE_000139 [Orobanche hederae]
MRSRRKFCAESVSWERLALYFFLVGIVFCALLL